MGFYEAIEKPMIILGLISMGFVAGVIVGGLLAQFWGICGIGPMVP